MKKLTCIFVVIFLSLSLTNNAFATVKTNSIKKLNTEVMTVPDNLPEHPSEVKPDDDAIVTENVPAELCGKSSVISGCLIGV